MQKTVAVTPANNDYLGLWYKYVAAETGQTVAQLRTLVEGSRVHGQPASDHVIVHFGKMYSKMQQDLQPIYLGQITAKQQMPVLQQDVQQIINQIQ
jgi:hypothetical protein